MKKSIILSIAAAAAFATAAFTANTVSAADQATSTAADGDHTAKITLTQEENSDGSDKGVVLEKAADINFGSQTLKANGGDYTSKSVTPALQVTNYGASTPWSVTAALGEFKNDEAGKPSLSGVTLALNAGTPAAQADDNRGGAATVASIKLGQNAGNATAFKAETGAGVGTWTDTFNDTDAKLTVPAGNLAGSYTASLTWTLSQDPTTAAATPDANTQG